ncbi:Serine/threonine-protein kinase PknB [Planctomycetales bacterium 10988]|nr:Serine/threonine-protein kinase PknB [Planctomycetales bacterium 10988]
MAKQTLTVEQYQETVHRSELVEDEVVQATLNELGISAEDECLPLAQKLQENEVLTSWHNSHLLEGRFAGFFLGKYKLLSMLGAGGMGAVYLAEHILMQRKVAVKVLYVAHVDKTNLQRFYQESRAVAALNHPNIVSAYHFDSIEDFLYLVMEFVNGPDLQSLVEQNGPLPYLEAADYIAQGADSLAHAHDAGMVHRDIKPANYLRDGKGILKLLDLGVARMSGSKGSVGLTLPGGQSMLGTVDYLAPEQALDSSSVDVRADIYSLGCTFYYLLTGHPPFPEGTQAQRLLAHQIQDPTPVKQERDDAPEDLIEICMKMMAKAAPDRYQTAKEVSKTLRDWIRRTMRTQRLLSIPRTEPQAVAKPSTPPAKESPSSVS